jgi:toxin ParE1/3/4
MLFLVRFTAGARNDLCRIQRYIGENDSIENATCVVHEIIRAGLQLRELPQRGTHPAELLQLGNRTYRQVFFKPYRILYRIHANTVFIALIADERRDMNSLFMRRLTES